MKNIRQETIDTYNRSAEAFSEYFKGIGPRDKDINRAYELAGRPKNPKVVEIGCGDGRDAAEILKITDDFIGIDTSSSFIDLARKNVPEGHFEVADATTFEYPKDLDLVFAFASLLHLNQQEVAAVLKKVQQSLKPGGIFSIVLRYMPEYTERIEEDQFGRRQFYYYNPDLLISLAGEGYLVRESSVTEVVGREWMCVFLQKK